MPTSKLEEAYGKLKAGEPTGIELVERDRAYAISAIEEVLWERGRLSTKGSNPGKKEEAKLVKALLPVVGISTAVIVGFAVLVQAFTFSRRVYAQDGQYLVPVRYPGQWHDLREFVQPHNPDILAVFSQYGPDPWALYDFVCQSIDYRRDWGEFFQFPSETLKGYGDCEDSSILLTSLIRAGGVPDCHVALGSLGDWGHSWCQLDGQILETTFTSARVVPNPAQYCPYVLFDNEQVIELWPGALGEVFELGRDEATKLNLIAKASEKASVSNPDAFWLASLAGPAIIGAAILIAATVKR